MTPDASLLTDPDLREAAAAIAAVRRRAPLVHCITATVSMGIVADGLLATGARPMMTESLAEAPTLTSLADALLINVGTLSSDAMESIPVTVRAATALGRPWVLDPTAIGRAPVRTRMARELLAERPAAVRGNASEVLALLGGSGGRGADADAADGPEQALAAAREVASRTGGVVAVSGRIDLIVDGEGERAVQRGDPLLTRVTGTGCLLGALTAACIAATADGSTTDDGFRATPRSAPRSAAAAASIWMDVAGERAARTHPRPGSFRTALLDELDVVGEAAERIAEQIEASGAACGTPRITGQTDTRRTDEEDA